MDRIRPDDLPDFCHARAVFLLILLGLMLAVMLALAGAPAFSGFWTRLGLAGVMIETIILAACLLLCLARRHLAGIPAEVAYAAIFVVIQLITAGFSWMATFWIPGLAGDGFGWWLTRNVLLSSIASLVFLRYLILHRRWQAQVRAETRARLDALQARIRPHFLFNALNTIAGLVRTRPAEAEQAVLDLADLLRIGLRPDAEHTLGEELELVRGYLRVESLRLGDRLEIDWQVDDRLPLDRTIPALIIQPLVENSIVHGIARRPDGGTLRIRAQPRSWGKWRIRIDNPLPDAPDDSRESGGHRMALDNIRQRLELAYDDRARLSTGTGDGRFFAVLDMPASR